MGVNVPHLKEWVGDAHARGIRTKVYYTTGELTINTPEIWALRSLNGEIIYPGGSLRSCMGRFLVVQSFVVWTDFESVLRLLRGQLGI
jgi:hypothetical protein